MSRPKTSPAAARTNPPDRDGDGDPGGSLPGNATVDEAKGPQAPEAARVQASLTDPAAAAIETFQTEGGAEEAAADDTFTPEEIAAGQTLVAEQEGEAETTAALATETAQAELVAVAPDGPDAQPVAVRRDELQRLVDNGWLYKTRDGFSPSYSAPFVSPETIAVWLEAGLAEDRPSAGREGGVYVTAKAAQAVARPRAA